MKILYNILKEHGLDETLPCYVSLKPTQFLKFDWAPIGYTTQKELSFVWDNIKCSIISGQNKQFCIRVYDIAEKIYEHGVDPTPNNTFKIYTTTLTLQKPTISMIQHNE